MKLLLRRTLVLIQLYWTF